MKLQMFLLAVLTAGIGVSGAPLKLKMNYYDKYNGGDFDPGFRRGRGDLEAAQPC